MWSKEAMNHTDERVLKLFRRGVSIPAIARKIGRPDDFERVRAALRRSEEGARLAADRGIDLAHASEEDET